VDGTPLGALLAGKYEIRKLIGRGGMGAVYEGLHIEIGKRVAVKLLDTEHSRSQEVEARFRLEGRAASKIESEHVVQVFDVGRDDQFGLYMVMEYLVGEDLATRLEREGVLEVQKAMEIAQQVARGLAKAHAAGVIHRDLKPGNVVLAERDDGTTIAKIVDFGISKLLTEDADKDGVLTRYGSAVGTPQYMSPEQAQGQTIDARSDVWALGAVFYEMLSGRPAYPLLENYEQTIFSIVLKRPAPLREVAPWVPESVAAIVAQAMEPELSQRIPDCVAFGRLLAERARTVEVISAPNAAAPLPLVRESERMLPIGGPVPSERAKTVSGVEVKTGHHAALDDFGDAPAHTPPSIRTIVAAVVIAVLAIAGAALWMRQGGTTASANPAESSAPAAAPSPSPKPHHPVPQLKPKPHLAASASASASASTSTKASSKPVASGTPSAKPSGDDQFGGIGVSNSY